VLHPWPVGETGRREKKNQKKPRPAERGKTKSRRCSLRAPRGGRPLLSKRRPRRKKSGVYPSGARGGREASFRDRWGTHYPGRLCPKSKKRQPPREESGASPEFCEQKTPEGPGVRTRLVIGAFPLSSDCVFWVPHSSSFGAGGKGRFVVAVGACDQVSVGGLGGGRGSGYRNASGRLGGVPAFSVRWLLFRTAT